MLRARPPTYASSCAPDCGRSAPYSVRFTVTVDQFPVGEAAAWAGLVMISLPWLRVSGLKIRPGPSGTVLSRPI